MSQKKLETSIIRQLQGTIPLDTLYPYEEVAHRCGVTEEELLGILRAWQEQGVVRRMGAVVRHQRVGRVANVMSVWKVPQEKTDEVARVLCAFEEVTHCYERETPPGWQYNLFAMISAETPERCREIAENVARQSGVSDYRLLESLKEYKKESLRYF